MFFTIKLYTYVHYLHFPDYCPHLCRHIYHNVLAIVRSLLVVRMSNLTLYSAYRGRLFWFHEPCLMDVSYLLLISPLKVLHCLHQVLNSLFGYLPGSNQCLYPLYHMSLSIHAKLTCLKWNCFWHWNCTHTKLDLFSNYFIGGLCAKKKPS